MDGKPAPKLGGPRPNSGRPPAGMVNLRVHLAPDELAWWEEICRVWGCSAGEGLRRTIRLYRDRFPRKLEGEGKP